MTVETTEDLATTDLDGRYVRLDPAHHFPVEDESYLIVLATGGFGCTPKSTGKVFCRYRDGEVRWARRVWVERFATAEEVAAVFGC